ncbi:pre-mRNA-splicing regulator female-lethal(2)D [Musca domestica]|uniref:Pre-mRNA-splicing regulator female-lethal(2)D n=2 Tax=Musca domestica TaxID=7370 RepID=A0A1I8MDN9_MUSDO|nr:pre-mRNA-splicing regulator female-lethal(2)D [Musca domestica]
MSVAAMTMDDQRPLMNSYDKMSSKYEQNLHNASSSSSSVVGGGNSVSGGGGGVGSMGGNSGGLLSGPASPTPSVTEEPTSSSHHAGSHHHHHSAYSHHHHHQHHHHPHHVHHAVNQQQQQQQQQQSSRPSSPPISTGVMHQDTVAAAAIIAAAEQRQRQLEDEIENLKLEQQRLTMQCTDAQRREKILMRRLANKEQEFQDYVSQIAEYKAAQAPSAVALRSALLDPAVNLLFQKLKKELKATKAKLEETQNELSAWKFTPDSNTGKRLMAKCRLLYQENEELGKMTSNGRLAKLETELSMQKSFSEEVKKSQSELDDFLQELDEDVEGMQSTILFLQQELKTTRDRIQVLEKENFQLKTGISSNQDEQQEAGVVNMIKNEQEMSPAANNNAVVVDGQEEGDNKSTAAAAVMNGNIYGNDVQMSTTEPMYKQQMPLEAIDENVTMRTVTQNTAYYNGSECDAAMSELIHEGNGGGAIGAKMRTVASRKRNYDCDAPIESIQMTPMAAQQQAPIAMVSSPRTLPPKKSKLRVVPPTRRSSIQSIDENEMLINATTVNSIVDNAMDGMANEESAACVGSSGDPLANDAATSLNAMDQQQQQQGSGMVAQRIMTRRRSVRLNGASNGGGGGGDSNH